jgi:hypothetical protein
VSLRTCLLRFVYESLSQDIPRYASDTRSRYVNCGGTLFSGRNQSIYAYLLVSYEIPSRFLRSRNLMYTLNLSSCGGTHSSDDSFMGFGRCELQNRSFCSAELLNEEGILSDWSCQNIINLSNPPVILSMDESKVDATGRAGTVLVCSRRLAIESAGIPRRGARTLDARRREV